MGIRMLPAAVLVAMGLASALLAQDAKPAALLPAEEVNRVLLEQHAAADRALRKGWCALARELFVKALQNDPEKATLMYGLSLAHSGLRDTDAARRSLRRAEDLGIREATMAGGEAVRWRFAGSRNGAFARPPEGDWLAAAPALGRIHILETASGAVRHRLLPGLAPTVALAASPEGDLLASLDVDGQLWLIDPTTGELMLADAVPEVAGDGKSTRLVFAAGGQRIQLATAAGLASWNREGRFLGFIQPANRCGRPRWCLQPALLGPLALEINERSVHLHDVTASEPTFHTVQFEGDVKTAALSANGKVMAVGTAYGGVYLVDAAAGVILWSATVVADWTGDTTDVFGCPLNVSTLSFDAAGRRLAICTTSGFLVTVFDVASGEALWRSQFLGGRMGSPMALNLGLEVLVGDNGRLFWNAATGEKLSVQVTSPERAALSAHDGVLTSNQSELEFLDSLTGVTFWSAKLNAEPAGPIEHPSGRMGGAPLLVGEPLDPWRFDPQGIRAAFEGKALLPPPVKGPDWKPRVMKVEVEMPVPEIEGEDFEEQSMRLSDFRGKVTVLEFSRRSNPLSRGRLVAAERLMTKHASDPVAWIGVLSDTKESYREQASERGVSWPSFYDGGTAYGSISTSWGVTKWPTIFVIDHEGILRHRGISRFRLESAVRTLLKRMEKG